MATRTEKLRRRQHRKEKKRQRARGLGSDLARPGDMLVIDPPGAAKMSEALWALVQPECDLCADEEAMTKLLSIGLAAWNAALMKGAERTAFLESLTRTFPIELRQDFKQIVEPFIRRKEELFPHIQRPIVSFELTWLPSGDPYLSVLSGLT
jgi:hypothetical protein